MTFKKTAAVAILVAGWVQAAAAGTSVPFTNDAFTTAQKSGKPLLVEVYAPWCPVCARQQPILDGLEASPAYAGVTVLRVDFDSQKSVLQALHVAKQSTLIGFHGSTETGRSVGVVQKDKIEALLASTTGHSAE